MRRRFKTIIGLLLESRVSENNPDCRILVSDRSELELSMKRAWRSASRVRQSRSLRPAAHPRFIGSPMTFEQVTLASILIALLGSERRPTPAAYVVRDERSKFGRWSTEGWNIKFTSRCGPQACDGEVTADLRRTVPRKIIPNYVSGGCSSEMFREVWLSVRRTHPHHRLAQSLR